MMDIMHRSRQKSHSYCHRYPNLMLLCLIGALTPQGLFSASGAATKPVKTRPTETTTATSESPLTTFAASNGTAVNASAVSDARYDVTSTTSLQNLIRKVNCTEKEIKAARCHYGHCYVIEHPGGRDAPACECWPNYFGKRCHLVRPIASTEDPTRSQTIVGIVVPIVALLVTGVVVYIMCRMKTRRAATCPGGSGRNRHGVILATADNRGGKDIKSEDVPLIASNSLPTGLGATGGST